MNEATKIHFESALGAEIRGIEARDHDGAPARVVIASRRYDTDVEDLWDALTSPERIPRWLAPISGDLRQGGRYQIEGNASGLITRCDPPRALDVTWEFDGNTSWVRVRLTPQASATKLVLEHISPRDEAGDAHWDEFGPGATGVGWECALFGMGLHLGSDTTDIDLAVSNAWLATDPGRAFLRACAQAWGDVHAAAGEPLESARGMAARTAAAYAGD